MTRRTYINIILLALIIPVNELYHLWEHVSYNVNPWISRDYPLDIQWYIKFLCLNVADVLKATVIYRLSRMNQVLRIAAGTYLVFTILDLGLFFWNFNHSNYLMLYSLTSIIIIMISYPKRKRQIRVTKITFKKQEEETINL